MSPSFCGFFTRSNRFICALNRGLDTKNRKSNLPPEELEKRKEIILRHLQMVVREARENVESKDDWAQIAEHIGKVAARIGKTLEIAD